MLHTKRMVLETSDYITTMRYSIKYVAEKNKVHYFILTKLVNESKRRVSFLNKYPPCIEVLEQVIGEQLFGPVILRGMKSYELIPHSEYERRNNDKK